MGFSELLLYGLFFAVFLVLNHVMQRAARARQRAETTSAPAPTAEADEAEVWRIPATGLPDEPPLDRVPPVEPPATAPRRAREREAALAGGSKRRSRAAALRLRLRSRRGLREAVIAMTVLGPCRSQAPPE